LFAKPGTAKYKNIKAITDVPFMAIFQLSNVRMEMKEWS
jgi:hypothetical protein